MARREQLLLPERALLHPLWLASLVLLALNDHVFKGAGLFHQLVTGKLSDVAGMIVAPALLAALVRARRRSAIAWCHAATAIGFSAVQLSDAAAGALVEAMGWLGLSWRIWCDPSDLLALPALLLSWRMLVPAMERELSIGARARQALELGAAAAGLVACLGTSSVPPPEAPPPPPSEPAVAVAAEPEPAVNLANLQSARWRSEDGDFMRSYRFDGERYVTSGNPPWEESGRVQLLESDGRRMRVLFHERVYDGKEDEPLERWISVAPDGQSFEMDGRVYRRQAHAAVVAAE